MADTGDGDAAARSARVKATDRHQQRTAGRPNGAFVEVSHEALIREWADLRQWVDEDREDLRFGRRLATDADEWDRTKDPGALLRGARLLKAKEWLDRHPDVDNGCPRIRGREQRGEERRSGKESRRNGSCARLRKPVRRPNKKARAGPPESSHVRRFAWTMSGLALVALGAAGNWYWQQRKAMSRQLAAQAEEVLSRDQGFSLDLALRAWGIARTAEAHRAIADAFASRPPLWKDMRGLWRARRSRRTGSGS